MSIYDRPYQNKDIEWRFRHFKKLCETGIPLAVFCSRDVEEQFRNEILTQYPNVKLLEAINLNETWTYKTYEKVAVELQETNSEIALPNTRCEDKDTKEYLLLMNAKTEWVTRAIEHNPYDSTHYAWIDFNIFHIFTGGREPFAKYLLDSISRRTMAPRFLTLPGCWGKEYVKEDFLMNDICWRFCGGFFTGSAGRMSEFHSDYLTYFEDFLRTQKKLVWEVNFWAWLELRHGLSVIWYNGDHNESILAFDAEWMSMALCNLSSFSASKYDYPDWGDYLPTSTSYVYHKGKHIINTRLVNYWLHPNGAYWIKDPDGSLRTRNVCAILDENTGLPTKTNIPSHDETGEEKNFYEIVLKEEELECHGGNIYGLEDIRLYNRTDNAIGFVATTMNFSGLGRSRIARGIYDLDSGMFHSCSIIIPPNPDSWCEKNWTPLVKGGIEYFIYRWSPFELGVLHKNEEGQEHLVIETSWKHRTPLFSKVRGSTPFVETEQGWIGVVHFSYDGHPRRYFHILVLLDKNTLTPLKYSNYFVFNHVTVEFCVGFTIKSDKYQFWISNFDRDPEVISMDITDIPFLFDFIEE
jgi:hypothetical protein